MSDLTSDLTSELPSVHLLFDLSGLLVGKTREWQEFASVGQCFLPQLVYAEMQFLANVGADHPQEKKAKEFMRFLSGSNWQLTNATASHANLQPPGDRRLAKRSRFALSVAEAAYGFSRASTGRLVVLISNDQAMLRRIQALEIANLTGLPVSALLIWGRTGRRPAVVAQHMQQMRVRRRELALAGTRSIATATVAAPLPLVRRTVMPRPVEPKLLPFNPLLTAVQQLVSGLSAAMVFAIALLIAWYLVQPKSFNQFLRQRDLPTLPTLPGSK